MFFHPRLEIDIIVELPAEDAIIAEFAPASTVLNNYHHPNNFHTIRLGRWTTLQDEGEWLLDRFRGITDGIRLTTLYAD